MNNVEREIVNKTALVWLTSNDKAQQKNVLNSLQEYIRVAFKELKIYPPLLPDATVRTYMKELGYEESQLIRPLCEIHNVPLFREDFTGPQDYRKVLLDRINYLTLYHYAGTRPR